MGAHLIRQRVFNAPYMFPINSSNSWNEFRTMRLFSTTPFPQHPTIPPESHNYPARILSPSHVHYWSSGSISQRPE